MPAKTTKKTLPQPKKGGTPKRITTPNPPGGPRTPGAGKSGIHNKAKRPAVSD